ncbi:MAG: thiamine pyrophosphate-dependent enzyme [Acidobacteriota bacterium]
MSETSTVAAAQPAAISRERVMADYRLAVRSRQVSLLGRREVLTGKAKFGIFGDGKEIAQLAMAAAWRPGDFRSGYYRDQTLAFALGIATIDEFFAQLYADPDVSREPHSAGRSMSAHFGTRWLNADGSWTNQTLTANTSSDVSPTGSQMPRLVGLAQASKLYRQIPGLAEACPGFSRPAHPGDEIAWGTIGNASCAEGMFWESLNAAGVLQVPMLVSVWDDGYGISVPNEHQLTAGLSRLVSGLGRVEGERGFDLYQVRGWDYVALLETYQSAAERVRREHVPALVHVVEMTQPQGHSTSGSHERYKSRERLQWEEDFDPIRKLRQWMTTEKIATAVELDAIDEEETKAVRAAQRRAWDVFRAPVDAQRAEALSLIDAIAASSPAKDTVQKVRDGLARQQAVPRREVMVAAREVLLATRGEETPARRALIKWQRSLDSKTGKLYASHLTSDSPRSPLAVPVVPAEYASDPAAVVTLNGFEILNACFDAALARYPNLLALGEDVGQLGDVNQGFAGLQAKYGELRVADTGIREITILGQAIGLAMRGLRPIAEVQYLDYILYCLQILSDDLATLRWRTAGGQAAPVIVRTRGHRLEGIWHSGSPMAGVLNLVRGIHLCVPRNMVQAAGFYNTLLQGDDPAIVVEVLNGYRNKERLPKNLSRFTVPLGVPEVLRSGADVTVVTYGACCKLALETAEQLAGVGIDTEVIDVQTLLPFDRHGAILESLKKTSRILFLDEDVPGGASAYMLQQVIDGQGGFAWCDTPPRTLAAKAHRPAYGSDGDYWSKPNRETIFEAVYELMNEAQPAKFPIFWR